MDTDKQLARPKPLVYCFGFQNLRHILQSNKNIEVNSIANQCPSVSYLNIVKQDGWRDTWQKFTDAEDQTQVDGNVSG